MKKLLFLLLLTSSILPLSAQNIQFHYDFGRNIYTGEEAGRQKVTVTLEQFKADPWGSWYYFVDLDMTSKFMECAYTEISREINLSKQLPFAVHAEYDGGVTRNGSLQHAGLLGMAYNGHTGDFSKTWSVQVLYKQFFRSNPGTHSYASAQLTGVWGLNFFNKKLTFSGFIDFWRGEKMDNGHGCLVILSEPQLWYNFTEHFSLGTEWEFSNNFVVNQKEGSTKTFFWNPTIAAKWNF
jgi:hypothetical protein